MEIDKNNWYDEEIEKVTKKIDLAKTKAQQEHKKKMYKLFIDINLKRNKIEKEFEALKESIKKKYEQKQKEEQKEDLKESKVEKSK